MGKASKNKRACPAAGREISSAECGEGRISRFACPASCPFNPWRVEAYEESLALQDRLEGKLFARLRQDLEKSGLRFNPPSESPLAMQVYVIDQLFRHPDGDGRTFFQRWEARGFDGLNNDERVLFQAQARMRVRAIEIRTVREELDSEATDLLDPQAASFTIADNSLAISAGRFSPYLAWMFEMPHYWRMHGVAISIPEVQSLEPDAVLRASVAHLRGSDATEPLQDWLDGNFSRMAEALQAIPPVLWEKTFSDPGMTQTVYAYRLQVDPADVAQVMAAWPEVDAGDTDPKLWKLGFRQSWDWLAKHSRCNPHAFMKMDAQPLRATISMSGTEVLLTVPVGGSAVEVRTEFEERLGSRAVFAGERVDELGRQTEIAKSVTPRQRELVPTALLQHAHGYKMTISRMRAPPDIAASKRAIKRMLARDWLDDAIPALDGLTPRQAATDPLRRPVLLLLVKDRIRSADLESIREFDVAGDDYMPSQDDPAALARELGLVELDMPPPPGLYPPPRPLLPPLPASPLAVEEVEARFDMFYTDRGIAVSAMLVRFQFEADVVYDAFSSLAETIETEWPAVFDVLLAMAWFILFPREQPYRLPSGDKLAQAIQAALDQMYEFDGNARAASIKATFESRRQPNLVSMLRGELLAATNEKGKARIEHRVAFEMALILRVLVDAFDAVARPEA